ncbi:MAG: hypothetical protein U0835_12680 [Isosphaeraceae bacterium]
MNSPNHDDPAAPDLDPGSRGGAGRFVAGVFALAAAGVALSLTPLLVRWLKTGDAMYLADGDQLLYMAWSREIITRGVWSLCDGVNRQSGPMMHPWALFVPVAQVARALGAGILGLTVVWRVPAGFGVALGLLAAVFPAVRDRRVALGVAALLLFDAGLMFGQPVIRQLDVLYSALAQPARYFSGTPRAMAHLRVVPPSLAFPFLLAMQGLAMHARATGSRRAAVGAGVLLGLLIHLYLYFWTVAVGGLMVALVLDPKGRRGYAWILGVGLAIGFPAILANARVKASTPPDWLNRTEKFVPIARFQELLVPKVMIGLWALCAPVVFLRRRELTPLWCTVGAGLVCTNHQVVSRLQIENFHWLVPAGTLCSVLLWAIAAPWLFEPEGRAPRLRLLALLVAAQVGLGFYLRVQETVRPPETYRYMHLYEEFRSDSLTIPPGAVLGGTPDPVLLSSALGEAYPLAGKLVEYSAPIKDDEFDERLMLNLYLIGLTRDQALAEVAKPPGTLSWESLAVHSETVAKEQEARRRSLIERIWPDPAPVAARYGLSHVILPADAPDPTPTLQKIGPTRRVLRGKHWQLWQVEPRPLPAGNEAR